jgi:hypothetical protein
MPLFDEMVFNFLSITVLCEQSNAFRVHGKTPLKLGLKNELGLSTSKSLDGLRRKTDVDLYFLFFNLISDEKNIL